MTGSKYINAIKSSIDSKLTFTTFGNSRGSSQEFLIFEYSSGSKFKNRFAIRNRQHPRSVPQRRLGANWKGTRPYSCSCDQGFGTGFRQAQQQGIHGVCSRRNTATRSFSNQTAVLGDWDKA